MTPNIIPPPTTDSAPTTKEMIPKNDILPPRLEVVVNTKLLLPLKSDTS